MRFLVNIDVDNLDHGIAFYTRAFGLHPGRRFGADGVELLGGPAPVYLLAKPAGSASTPQVRDRRDYRRHWTPLHLDWVVDDVDAALTRAVQAGARVEQAPATHAWGRIALLADPFGHGFCLLQFLGDGYDAISTG
ncbi:MULTISPECIES: VOC family protein [Stenotrophomonas]|jgi:predicted enzyme related to lactoylglutathione lyase|uniref:VOC family protein n=1 Tax=Stenotrophomonas maltophilia TaxID=40324 RepID=A0A4S2D041_STEMA|nr:MULTISPECIES: VOC family protein [Stenotrophomonas]MBD3826292.1 VOC family protein [Stenotrophomonas sp.]QIO89474.1 glyoxalase [Stenotrophomonas rhizophila]TGY33793.1 VOC family protein [Stenotrophomonas maltophilia]HBS61807.1 glyoxalase [Stenotrophomonas sp.]